VFNLIEVVEKTSPPAPVEILPSNAGQDIAPTQSAGRTKILKVLFLISFLNGPFSSQKKI